VHRQDLLAQAVDGDVTFGRDVVVRGDVAVSGPRAVADGEVLQAE